MNTPIPPADWPKVLADVTGELVGRERKVATADLVKLLGANEHAQTWTRIGKIMRDLGWDGPKVVRIVGGRLARGFYRLEPQAPPPPAEEPAVAVNCPVLTPSDHTEPGALPQKLEKVSGMALAQAEEILSKPIEGADGNLMRAKTAIVGRRSEHSIEGGRKHPACETRRQRRARSAREDHPPGQTHNAARA